MRDFSIGQATALMARTMPFIALTSAVSAGQVFGPVEATCPILDTDRGVGAPGWCRSGLTGHSGSGESCGQPGGVRQNPSCSTDTASPCGRPGRSFCHRLPSAGVSADPGEQTPVPGRGRRIAGVSGMLGEFKGRLSEFRAAGGADRGLGTTK